MRKLIACTAALLCSFNLMAAQYVGLDLGTNHAQSTNGAKDPKIGAKFGFRYGYMFDSGIRAEFHITHRVNHFKTAYTLNKDDQIIEKELSSVRSWSYMANAIYDITQITMKAITPYVGAGIGYCQNSEEHKTQYDTFTGKSKMKDNRFAWQAIAGAHYAINDQLTTGIEYHYFCGKSHAKEHSFGVTLARSF